MIISDAEELNIKSIRNVSFINIQNNPESSLQRPKSNHSIGMRKKNMDLAIKSKRNGKLITRVNLAQHYGAVLGYSHLESVSEYG